ncbi:MULTISPECIES: outer membrane protein transport protein [Aeromonas]|jgi:long-chain fatty acid transport protein|uniref:Outer membrane protein transport protein n=1 Tax=Aeromonas caviae TaxID=648 RepID=A0A7T3X5D5_AERCA|nr:MULTISPECIES: outer membrane protein transport protein [Aeromonas]MBP6791286.1 outer membrane protein transport protein [Aeromonas sp.]MBP8080216.1 outer membrane protein transport protein [Aeromonas sp.]MEA9424766.1 outer membrane protein transport protein [Aeromonas caviae]MEA9428927.1 outer membrane protein transport protein [Aeromonas caviae]MEA9433487.1 outer membrane protein transport protein [Aeromonas caviae]
MTTAFFKKSLIAAAVTLASTQTFAAAFQLNEHSASGLGRAYAGEAAIADNAAVLSRNPAAMTTFDKMALSVSGTYIKPDVDVAGDIYAGPTKLAPSSESDIAPDAFVPATYFIQPLNDQWAWGIGLFSNYGLSTEYSKTFAAGAGAGDTELLTFNINPNIAYRINSSFSVGAGINAVYAAAELNRYAGALSAAIPGANSDTRLAHLKGDTWGFGWNVGTLYEINENNRLALTYRSQVDLSFDGDFQGATSLNRVVDGNLKLDLPAQAEFAGYHRLNQQFAVHYSVNWTDWSAFQELKATSSGCNMPGQPGVCLNKPEKFKDSTRYSLGGTWYVNPSWEARIGFAYDNTPIEPEYRSLSIPDSDRVWYSAGATYHIDKDMSVDFGMAYLDGKEVDVNEGLRSHDDGLRWKGTSHGNALLASAQFNMKF